MTGPWSFRDGTLDQAIFNAVVRFNEYRLPERFVPTDIVIDVGAHIGSFAQAVLSRGCRFAALFREIRQGIGLGPVGDAGRADPRPVDAGAEPQSESGGAPGAGCAPGYAR